MKPFLLTFLMAMTAAAEAPRPDARPLLAVDHLQTLKVDSADAAILEEALASELLRTGKVRVLERSQMQRILKEQGFQQSGLCETSSCAVEVGRLLGVDRLVVGSLGRMGSTLAINLRLVDVATGEMVATSSRTTGASAEELLRAVPAAARELVRPASAPSAESAPPRQEPAEKGWLGFTYGRPGPPGVQALRTLQGKPDSGVEVRSLALGGPAEAAGLRAGDIVLLLDGAQILGVDDLGQRLRGLAPGHELRLTVLRGGKELTIAMVAGRKPKR